MSNFFGLKCNHSIPYWGNKFDISFPMRCRLLFFAKLKKKMSAKYFTTVTLPNSDSLIFFRKFLRLISSVDTYH